MSVAWLNATALWGLALLAIPIAIHLLVREQTRTVAYPSLRFVRDTALAAFRRRAIQDAALLVCRAAIVAAAVLAIAGPILQTASRAAGYAGRVSRAIVQLDASSAGDQLRGDAFQSRTFIRATVADALSDAVRWLDAQPPSAREIVFGGTFRRGQIAKSDLAAVPADIGVRFAAAETETIPEQFTQQVLLRRDGRLVFARRQVRLAPDETSVEAGETVPAPADAIRVVASPQDQSLADAALETVLDAGVRWPRSERRLIVEWEGAAPSANADVLRIPVPDPPATAATAIADAISAATPRDAVEPVAIPRGDLEAWSRPPGPVSPDARPGDEGDRRWLWAVALVLLAAEHGLRRDRARSAHPEARRAA